MPMDIANGCSSHAFAANVSIIATGRVGFDNQTFNSIYMFIMGLFMFSIQLHITYKNKNSMLTKPFLHLMR